MICNVLGERVPLLQRNIYLANKNRVGRVDDVFGPMSKAGIAIKPDEGVKAESFKAGDKVSSADASSSQTPSSAERRASSWADPPSPRLPDPSASRARWPAVRASSLPAAEVASEAAAASAAATEAASEEAVAVSATAEDSEALPEAATVGLLCNRCSQRRPRRQRQVLNN